MQGIILINRPFAKQINLTEGRTNQDKSGFEVKTFPVPFPLVENLGNLTINTNTSSKLSREEVINKAIKFHSQGNFSEASKYYQYLIKKGHKDHKIFSNYGIVLKNLGQLKKAAMTCRKAIELNPNFADAHSNLGNILRDLGRLEEAESSTRKAIQLNPNLANAHSNLGNIFRDLCKLEEAELSTRKAIQLNPNLANAHSNLGNIYKDMGELEAAELSYSKAIQLNPNFANAYSNLGNTLKYLGKSKEAELSYRKAIQLNPNFANAYSNLGNILRDLGELEAAELSTRKAIELNPDSAEAHTILGIILKDLGNLCHAINQYKQALKLNSELSLAKVGLINTQRTICDWNDERTHNIWLKSLGIKGKSINPWYLLSSEDNPLKHLQRSKKFNKENYSRPTKHINYSEKDMIHIGYFSADFRTHPVMQLIAPLLELHDKSRFIIYLYSFVPQEDEYTERAKKSGCIFRDITKLNDIEAVELARNDKLDVAVDLMGYTRHNRMPIFSYRVAEIQINYLGFNASVGSDNIDYIIADKITIPIENEKFYSEKIIRMPNCFLCNDNKQEISKESILRRDFNIPDQGFVFTCFNNNLKITKNEFHIWMNLLKKIEGSVLWLYKSNQWSKNNLCKEARKLKVDPERLIFADRLPLKKHLARHSIGDLALDTFNYNGGTTTSHALWAGLPVLTKKGQSFSARISASILNTIGLPELVTCSESEYEEKALYIARNHEEILRLKSKLNKLKVSSKFFNSELFTQDLENIYLNLVKN